MFLLFLGVILTNIEIGNVCFVKQLLVIPLDAKTVSRLNNEPDQLRYEQQKKHVDFLLLEILKRINDFKKMKVRCCNQYLGSTTTATIVCVTDNSLIKFDDQTAYAAVENLLWTNAYVYTYSTNVSGYYTAIVSHPNIIYDGGANPVTIQTTNGLFFNLDYLEVAAAWYDNLLLHVVGYKSNVVIANNTFTLQVFTVP